jgi:hypothetical protein
MPAGDPVLSADAAVPLAAWTTYTPVFTTSGGAAAVGAGYITGRYSKVGKMCKVAGGLQFGTGANGGAGGLFTMSLPFAAAASGGPWIGKAYLRDASATSVGHFSGLAKVVAGASLVTFMESTTKAEVNNGSPFSWTFGPPADFIAFTLTYETAS